MQANYGAGTTGPLIVGDEAILTTPIEPGAVMVVGNDHNEVTRAARAIADAGKKKRRRMAAKSRRTNR